MRLLALSLLLVVSASTAQETPADSTLGALTGIVTDAETGEPLVGANVYLPEIQRGAATDIDGRYTIPGLPFGGYLVRVSYVGYTTMDVIDVSIAPGQARGLNVGLETGEIISCPVFYCDDTPLISTLAYSGRTVRRDVGWRCYGATAYEALAFSSAR